MFVLQMRRENTIKWHICSSTLSRLILYYYYLIVVFSSYQCFDHWLGKM